MMSQSSIPCTQDHQWNAAIATNNVAVSLFDRGNYNDAMYTFQDSMKLMKSSITAATIPDDEIKLIMQNASHRSAESLSKLLTSEEGKLTTLVANSQQDSGSVYEMLNAVTNMRLCLGDNEATIFCCISIDPGPSEDACGVETLHLYSSVLLYNFGVAHLALAEKLVRSTGTANSDIVQKLLRSAFHLLRLCETNVHSNRNQTSDSGFSFLSSTIMLLLSRTLLQLAYQLDYEEMRVHYNSVYAEQIHTTEAVSSLFPIARLAHAAAA